MKIHGDLLGMALNDYLSGRKNATIKVHSPDFEEDEIRVGWYFRKYEDMPGLEQKAVDLCRGKILDAGAGAGSHSLYLQEKDKNVTALDISGGACEVMRLRGVNNVIEGNLFEYSGEKFDTLLLMMNGIGLCGNIHELDSFIKRLPEYLNSGGQLLFDSTNLIYLYQDREPSEFIYSNGEYFGEVQFRLEYDDYFTESFKWLYVDFETVSYIAESKEMIAEKVFDGENHHYLGRILL